MTIEVSPVEKVVLKVGDVVQLSDLTYEVGALAKDVTDDIYLVRLDRMFAPSVTFLVDKGN